MQATGASWCDIHIKYAKYRRSYVKDFFNSDDQYF